MRSEKRPGVYVIVCELSYGTVQALGLEDRIVSEERRFSNISKYFTILENLL